MKKQYIRPAATTTKVGLLPLLNNSSSLWVDKTTEGNPAYSDSRRYRNSLWDDEDF